MIAHPHDSDAENGYVGCLMASEGAVFDEFPVTLEHFFCGTTQLIIAACLDLYAAKKPVHALTVTSKLRELGTLDAAGGPHGVSGLFTPVSLASSYHVTLCEQLALRKAVEAAIWASNAWREVESADSFIGDFRTRITAIDITNEEVNQVPVAAKAIFQRLDRLDRGECVTGLTTGIQVWDDNFGGLVKGGFYALAGRPGTGKSAMLEQMVANLIGVEIPVLVFQRDMSPQKMIERLCCRWCGVPYWAYVRGIISAEQRESLRNTVDCLLETPLYVYNPIGLTAEKLCAIMRREKRIHGVQAVFLDHIQALKVGSDIRVGLTQASLTIRAAVTEVDLPFLTLAHINREGGKGKPRPDDIKEFDQLFGDVDGLSMLWNDPEDDHNEEKEQPCVVNFTVGKNRDGGPADERIYFDGPRLTFGGKAPKPATSQPTQNRK